MHPNWRLLGALTLTVAIWAGVAEGAFRLTHDGRAGLRHAIYAHALKAAHHLRARV